MDTARSSVTATENGKKKKKKGFSWIGLLIPHFIHWLQHVVALGQEFKSKNTGVDGKGKNVRNASVMNLT